MASSHGTKHDGILMQILLDALFAGRRRPIELIAKFDKSQAIAAVEKCYSKKLRVLERTHRCRIGVLHEIVNNGKLRVDYAPTRFH